MRVDELQVLRRQLERRANLVRKSSLLRISSTLRDFFLFFDSEQTLIAIQEQLLHLVPDATEIYRRFKSTSNKERAVSEKELAAAAYVSLRNLSSSVAEHPRNEIQALYNANLPNESRIKEPDETDACTFAYYLDSFFEPFYLYVDEQLDARRTMLNILLRYKHRCEWFERERLLEVYKDSRRGENHLALDLYRYLFDEGVDFTIEPSSLDGKVDLIAAQGTDDPLLADAKVFDGSNSKYIEKRGFRQIYSYADKYNERCGYLVIYNTSPNDLVIEGSDATSPIPSVSHNHRQIYFLVVDICKHEKPPSKRGPIKP